MSERMKAWRLANPERAKELNREAQARRRANPKNKMKIRKQDAAASKRYFERKKKGI